MWVEKEIKVYSLSVHRDGCTSKLDRYGEEKMCYAKGCTNFIRKKIEPAWTIWFDNIAEKSFDTFSDAFETFLRWCTLAEEAIADFVIPIE